MKKIKLTFIIAFVGLFLSSCSDLGLVNLDVPYDMEPDKEQAIANSADIYNILKGAYQSLSDGITTSSWVHVSIMSDNVTTTNAYRSFWTFAMEPRVAINNSTTWGDLDEISGFWSNFNSVISSANNVISYIIDQNGNVANSVVVNDVDVTTKTLAGAYFARGLALAYLGAIYDRAFIVTETSDLANLELSDYNEVIEAGLLDMQKAIGILDTTNADIDFDLFPEAGIDAQGWIKIIYSYMARMEAAKARTEAEAASVNWDNVIAWAESGITDDYSPVSNSDMANWYHNWLTYPLSGGAAYLPVDIKIFNWSSRLVVGDDYPWEYPSDGDVILPDAYDAGYVNDPRLQSGEYFWYTEAFGYLKPERGRYLFSNYGFQRYQYDHPNTYIGNPMELLHVSELQYLKAEAYLMKGDAATAKSILDASPMNTSGGMTVPNDNPDTVFTYLTNEVFTELYGNPGLDWFYMRRHDLLKKGTPTMYPIPANELEVLTMAPYTFGGDAAAGQPGTASGAKAWAPIHGSKSGNVLTPQDITVPFATKLERGIQY